MNIQTFDSNAFTDDGVYSWSGHWRGHEAKSHRRYLDENKQLRIDDKDTYLSRWTIGMSGTHSYREMIAMLNNRIKKAV